MRLEYIRVSRLYARVYLSTFYPTPSLEFLEKIQTLNALLSQKAIVEVLLRFHRAAKEELWRALDSILHPIGLGSAEKQLSLILLTKKRAHLLKATWKQVENELLVQMKKGTVEVKTSHQLSEEEKKDIDNLAALLYSSSAPVEYKIDPALIRGVRISTPSHTWEVSIRKILQTFTLKNNQF